MNKYNEDYTQGERSNKILNWVLIVLIFLATAMIIVVIYNINDLAKYTECINAIEAPIWCGEVK